MSAPPLSPPIAGTPTSPQTDKPTALPDPILPPQPKQPPKQPPIQTTDLKPPSVTATGHKKETDRSDLKQKPDAPDVAAQPLLPPKQGGTDSKSTDLLPQKAGGADDAAQTDSLLPPESKSKPSDSDSSEAQSDPSSEFDPNISEDERVLLPDGKGGFIEVSERKTSVEYRGTKVELNRMKRDEKEASRGFRDFLVITGCILFLLVLIYLLTNL